MELDKRMEIDDARMNKIRRSLTAVLTASDDDVGKVTRTIPRQARMFKTETSVDFSYDAANDRTVMEIWAADRPGLLSKVGKVFVEQGVDIAAAKIMTIGERAEDVFYISDEQGEPLNDVARRDLRDALVATLDETD